MIFETDSVQTFLLHEFTRRVRLNPRYSMRAYARTLGLSAGSLSEILRSRRPLSLRAATKVAKALGLNGAETKRLYDLIDTDKRKILNPTALSEAALEQKQLDEDTFHLVSEWHHFAILNLLDCDGFLWKASHIAKRLGLTVTQAQMSMSLLLRLGLVRQKGSQVKGVQNYVLSPSGIPSAAIRKYHRQMLEKAIQSIEFQNVEERDLSGVGFAVDPTKLPQMKREISEFQDQMIAKYSKGKKQEVYFLEIALFRLTKGEHNDNN
jgi:uncharacterized protein (TIGR02147 family)